MFAQRLAVIAGGSDQEVLIQPMSSECLEQLADGVIHRGDLGVIRRARESLLKRLGRDMRSVRVIVMNPQEERRT
jgi:hypothetical protein